MSPREKRLLLFFGLGGFLVLNFFGYSQLVGLRTRIQGERIKAEQTLENGNRFLAMRGEVEDEIDWLDKHEPDPTNGQEVQGKLQQFTEAQARASGLTIRNQKLLGMDTTGSQYHRAKVEIAVSGDETALYGWIDKLQVPTEFRAVTSLRLTPNKDDDSKIDATLTIEQWFVPLPPNA